MNFFYQARHASSGHTKKSMSAKNWVALNWSRTGYHCHISVCVLGVCLVSKLTFQVFVLSCCDLTDKEKGTSETQGVGAKRYRNNTLAGSEKPGQCKSRVCK